MRTATLVSQPSTDDGTFGRLTTDTGRVFWSGENIWADNEPNVSCVPAGTYRCTWFNSPKHGWCYLLVDVENRSMCEIHSANYMGDPTKGKADQLLGCIALGKAIGKMSPRLGADPQMAILQSKDAITEFDAEMNQVDFLLTIVRN